MFTRQEVDSPQAHSQWQAYSGTEVSRHSHPSQTLGPSPSPQEGGEKDKV